MERESAQRPLRRRAVLGTIAGGAATAILAACGGSARPTSTAPPSAGPTTAPTAGNSPTAAPVPTTTSPAANPTVAPASTTPAAGTTTSAGGTAGTTVAGTGTPNIAGPQVGTQTLRLAIPSDPRTLDPALADYANGAVTYIHLMYDALFSYDDRGTLIPRAAVAVPTAQNGGIADGGKTFTVKLRPGQTFSDGSPVTTKEYLFAIRRFLNPLTKATQASFMANLVGYDALSSRESASKSAQELQPLVDALGIAAPDDATLVFRLTRAQASFPHILAFPNLAPLKQDIVEQGGDRWWQAAKNHVTNGAWLPESFQSKQKFTFVQNPRYTGEKPRLQRLEFISFPSWDRVWTAYQSSEIDVASVPTANAQQIADDPAYKDQALRFPLLRTDALMFNNKRAPFDNPAVRKAFGAAIDRQAFAQAVFRGFITPTTTWIAPNEPGYNPAIGAQYAFDPAKARKILADAGLDPQTLPEIKLTYPNGGTGPTLWSLFQAQFRDNLGIEIRPDARADSAFEGDVAKGDFHFFAGHWAADYPDPENWLAGLFGTGAKDNIFGYANPRVDDLLARAGGELDPARRLALYDQAHRIVIDEDCALAPTLLFDGLIVHKPNLTGVTRNPMDAATGSQHAFRGFQLVKQ